ncbi:MAG: metallophosphoesterase [bacterium]
MRQFKQFNLFTILLSLTLVIFISSANKVTSQSLLDFRKLIPNKADSIKIIQISDVHYEEKANNHGKRLLQDSGAILSKAVSEINNIKNTDYVIFSGDMINSPDEKELNKFLSIIKTIKYPWAAIVGNHDVAIFGKLTKQHYMNILNEANCNIPNERYYSFSPKPNWLIIGLDGVIDNMISANGKFDKEELKWLDNQLTLNKDKHVIIFQHFPIVEPYKSATHKVLNVDDYLNIINNHKNVVAVLAGHYHAAKVDVVNNIAYIATPALVQFPNAYRILDFEEKNGKIIIKTQIKQVNYKTLNADFAKQCKEEPLNCGNSNDRNAIIELKK